MGKGKDKLNFDHYSYRIEFQIRGLPHLHGALWLARTFLDGILGTNSTLQESCHDREKIQIIIEKIVKKLISCEIPENDDNMKEKVLQVQVHKHTDTCTKKGINARNIRVDSRRFCWIF